MNICHYPWIAFRIREQMRNMDWKWAKLPLMMGSSSPQLIWDHLVLLPVKAMCGGPLNACNKRVNKCLTGRELNSSTKQLILPFIYGSVRWTLLLGSWVAFLMARETPSPPILLMYFRMLHSVPDLNKKVTFESR